MLFRRVCASALLVAIPTSPLLADVDRRFDRDCWERHEVAAAKIQRFKTMLLVGSLNCRDLDPLVVADYNRFLRTHRTLINANSQVVRDRFFRKYGPSYGLTAFSDYETQLGNRLSSAPHGRFRCERIASYARLAAQVSPAGLTDLAHSVDSEEPLRVCSPTMRYAGGRWHAPRPALEAAPVAVPVLPPAPIVAAAPPPVAIAAAPPAQPPAPEPVAEPAPMLAQTEWPDLAPVEPEVHPVAVDPDKAVEVAQAEVAQVAQVAEVATAEVATAPAAPDAAQALRAAIKSLTAAAEALEAERAAARPSTN